MTTGRHFEACAEPWVRWARTPGHDAYWHFRDAFPDRLPASSGSALEVGCEGRVTSDLRARGHAVVGADVAPTLLRHAREADPGGAYLLADALPFPDTSFDLLVAPDGALHRPRAGRPYVISGADHGSRPFEARAEHDGLAMAFSGRAHALESCSLALEAAGLLVESLHEPRPAPSAAGRHARWSPCTSTSAAAVRGKLRQGLRTGRPTRYGERW